MDKTKYKRSHRTQIKKVDMNGVLLGGEESLFLIAGPCIVEDISICTEIIEEASRICKKYNVNYIFKASYDKANKTIKGSYRGPGWRRGIEMLGEVKSITGVPILTDIHEISQCKPASEVADILQVPALLSKQIDLILAVAETGKVVNIKKGQFTAPWEANNVLSRMSDAGYEKILVTERGYMHGYQTLISDMRSLQIVSEYGYPVVFDGSHSVHANDTIISGTLLSHRDFIFPLIRSAVANGVDGVFLEIHPKPDQAKSDSIGTVPLYELDNLVGTIVEIDKAISNRI